MIDLLRAEWLKVTQNRWMFFFTVGVLPTVAFIALNIIAIFGSVGVLDSGRTSVNWQEEIILALAFANQLFSQILFIIFAGVIFAGENNWNTWKNILPRTNRISIVVSKYIIIVIVIILSTQGMALATGIGSVEVALLTQVPIESGSWDNVQSSFVSRYLWLSLSLFFNFTIAALYASLGALLTKSIASSIIIGIFFAFIDTVAFSMLQFMSRLPTFEFFADIPKVLPNFNVQNILSWVLTGQTLDNGHLTSSFLILIVWIIVTIGIGIYLFVRQDID